MKLEIGNTYTGTVTAKAEYGVFVAVKGIKSTGLMHMSQLRGNSQDLQLARLKSLEVGSDVIVEVTKLSKKNGLTRISFSEKVVHDDIVLNQIPLNEEIVGTVVRKGEYGVFLELPSWGVSGLLHFSRMLGDTKAAKFAEMAWMTPGSTVPVFVQAIERGKDDLKLTLSRIQVNPEEAFFVTEALDESGQVVTL